jgi:anaerobic selenocysteine-containing dehydrogenase
MEDELMPQKNDSPIEATKEDWVNTTCGGCYSGCAMRVKRINGKPVKLEGMTESCMGGKGGLCGKGVAGLMLHYDPYRLKKPLRRTNPEKGIGVDPKWKEISWEEALDEIGEKMKKLIEDDPYKVLISNQTNRAHDGPHLQVIKYGIALGQDPGYRNGNVITGGSSIHCGNAAHMMGGLVHAAWSVAPDWKYTKYVLKFGSSKGTGSGHSAMTMARLRSDAVEREIKEVVFDPMCNFAGGKATEWVPIIPGTDSAVCLAMCNYIVNELKTYDVVYLKAKTNLPYLIDEDGLYIRDKETDKPFVYDEKDQKIKLFDAPEMGYDDYALEGEYEIYGKKCRPAFLAMRDHLKQYSIPWASKISTVPEETIRRVATEWVENAQIGSTIEIDGKTFPYRPVAAVIFRGAQGHSNGIHQAAAIDLLSELVGAEDVPGGTMGWPSIRRSYPGGNFERTSRVGKDGIIIPGVFYGHDPWPPRKPAIPQRNVGCVDFWPHVTCPPIVYVAEREEIWEKLGMKTKPELLIGPASNFIISCCDWEETVEFFKDIFIVQCDIWSNETDEAVADIVLPDVSYIEKDCWSSGLDGYFFSQSPSTEDWYFHLQKAAADPPGEARFFMDVLLEVAKRAGFRDRFYEIINDMYSVGDENLKLKPGEDLTYAEIGDRMLPWIYGDDWKKIKEQGYATWEKRVEDVYWRWEFPSRVPLYMEFLIHSRNEVERICKEVDLDLDYKQYTALPSWFPPTSYEELNDEFDVLAFSYRDILHTNTTTGQNPMLDEVSDLCPYTYMITMHPDTAKKKGIEEGDAIWIENRYGAKEKGQVKFMEGQHPLTLGIAGQAGLYAKGRPISHGKGSNFCKILPNRLKHFDPVTGTIETAVATKVYKV